MSDMTETTKTDADENYMEIIEASRSITIGSLTKALASAHLQFTTVKKTEKVDYNTTAGRKKYNYAPLDEVIDATGKGLSENGLAVIQILKLRDGNTILETILSHSSGEWIKSESYVGKQEQAPQAEGSALTYKRRYSLSAILNVASEEDDDAQSAEGKKESPKVTLPSPTVPSKEPTKGNLPEEPDKPSAVEIQGGKTSPQGLGTSRQDLDTSSIDIVWLMESLAILEREGVKGWATNNVLSYLNNLTGQKAESIEKAVSYLSQRQAQDFIKSVQKEIERKF